MVFSTFFILFATIKKGIKQANLSFQGGRRGDTDVWWHPPPTGPFSRGAVPVPYDSKDSRDRCRSLDPRPSWARKQRIQLRHLGEGPREWLSSQKDIDRVAVWDCGGFWQLFSGIPKRDFPNWVIFHPSNFNTTGFFPGLKLVNRPNDDQWPSVIQFVTWNGEIHPICFLFSTRQLRGFNCS